MVHTGFRHSFMAAVLGCLLIALTSAGPAQAATNPTIVSGTHAATIPIPTALAEMASLPLPQGRWLVIVKAMITGVADDLATYSVNCRLSAGGDFDVGLATPTNVGSPNSRLPLVLTVVHAFGSPGEAVLRCAAHVAGSAVISLISMHAVKVGKLTNGPVGSVGTTTGTGTPQVISAFRDAVLFTDESDWSAPQDLPLSQGRWLIIAKAAVSGAQSGNILSMIQCRVVGMSGSSQLFGDVVVGHLAPVGLPSSRMVMAVQTAGRFGPAGGFVRFECSSQGSGHGFTWLKITAIKLGKLTLRDLEAGTATSSGSGAPRLIHGTSNSTGSISLPSTSYKTIAQLSLPAGKWLLNAKLWINAQGGSNQVRVDCRLAGSNTDESRFMLSNVWTDGPLWLQTIHSSSSTGNVRVRCKRVGSGWTFEAGLIRISAMRVGTLTQFNL